MSSTGALHRRARGADAETHMANAKTVKRETWRSVSTYLEGLRLCPLAPAPVEEVDDSRPPLQLSDPPKPMKPMRLNRKFL